MTEEGHGLRVVLQILVGRQFRDLRLIDSQHASDDVVVFARLDDVGPGGTEDLTVGRLVAVATENQIGQIARHNGLLEEVSAAGQA